MATKKPPHIERLHCNSCRIVTKHLLLKTRIDSGSDEEQSFYWQTKSEMFECCGCSSVLLRQIHDFRRFGTPNYLFPPPASRWQPQWQWSLPSKIKGLLAQVYKALQADSLSLAMMGARAILDTAIIDTVTDSCWLMATASKRSQLHSDARRTVTTAGSVLQVGRPLLS